VIDQITAEITRVAGVQLLNVDPGKDTNRTVVTFAGEPSVVVEAAYQAIRKAGELIDMSQHKGAHARMGATDVCPFVPVSGVTMAECAELARQLGRRVGETLGIPVYLYAEAASRDDRKRLPDIRVGEYEALPEKMKNPDFLPDFGPAVFHARSGATVIGARDFLIAYNINLNTRDTKIANEIAKRVREKGRTVKDPKTGESQTIPGTLAGVQGMGWFIPEYKMAQITVNILDHKITPIYRVFEECERFAAEFGVRVTGSELVGLVPLEALLATGRHALQKQGGSQGVSESELVRLAIQTLGLNEIAPFKPEERVIDYRFNKPGPLVSMTLSDFTDELASDSPAPGGGSIAALCGALSAGLASMVGNLTFGKKKYRETWAEMESVSVKAQGLKAFFAQMIDRDTDAFNQIMNAFSLPKSNPEETAARNTAIQRATQDATLVPFSVLERCLEAVELVAAVAVRGNQNSLSDAGVAGLCAMVAAEGALYNVLINLQGVEDRAWADDVTQRAKTLFEQIEAKADETRKRMHEKLGVTR
jgi:glutamate formiminotransferase/formiminotetrahydrofolate cyclodeaminase